MAQFPDTVATHSQPPAMFSTPLSLHTESVFELSSSLYEAGEGNAWVEANLHGNYAHSYLQGLCFDSAANIWVADTAFGRIFRINAAGEWQVVARYDGWPASLCFHADGRLIIGDVRHGLLALDTESGKVSPFLTHRVSQRFKGIADAMFAANGDLYISDCGQTGLHDPSGALYCLATDGKLSCLADNLPGPAGLCLSYDRNSLLLAMQGDNAVWQLPLVDAAVARAGRHLQLSGGSGPRGLAMDQDGSLYVAHDGMGCVWQFNKRGEPKYRIDSSRGDRITDVAIHPHHPHDVYLVEAQSGTILKSTLPMY